MGSWALTSERSAALFEDKAWWPALVLRQTEVTIKRNTRASLVAQWLRIRLPMQGTQVRALVREDPTCRGATKPVSHNY